jgi:anaphase-promoting complex subunit 10
MPRPARRPAAANDQPAATPTRNRLTAEIPAAMLETPPNLAQDEHVQHGHITTGTRPRNTSASHNDGDDGEPDNSQASTRALTAASELGEAEASYLSVQQMAEEAHALEGLREIGSLATWTLSSCKPSCGLPQLRSPNTSLFWQSDGAQPHMLTLYFARLVSIVKIRFYLDFELDESYTPTQLSFYAGMSEGSLVHFASWSCSEEVDPETGESHNSVEQVKGWIDVDLKGVGGTDRRYHEAVDDPEPDGERRFGDTLKAMVLQLRCIAQYQNGKDCHVRGFQCFTTDRRVEYGAQSGDGVFTKGKEVRGAAARRSENAAVQPRLAEWMGDPEIR